jgi:SSS family transporter
VRLRTSLEDGTDTASYFTADRTVGALVGGATLTATQVSAGTLVGTVGIHYLTGVSFLGVWLGIWAGWLASVLLVAPQLRAHGGYTVPDYLADRFGTGDGALVRGLAAALIAIIYLVYTTAQYVAGGVVLDALVGLGTLPSAVLFAAAALSYTVVGGMRASVYSDVAQVAVLLAALLVATAVGLADIGGLASLGRQALAADPALLDPTTDWQRVASLGAAFGLGITVAPYELSRVYAMRTPETVRPAVGVAVLLQAIIAACIAILGLLARVRHPALASPDAALVSLSLGLFGPTVGAVLLLGVLVAILSTVDSVLLVTSSAVAHDFYEETIPAVRGVARPPDASVMRVARAATVLAALVPIALTTAAGSLGGLVQLIVALYSSLLAATLFAPVVAGLHWPSATAAGAVAGILVGFVVVVAWQALTNPGAPLAWASVVNPVFPGVAASALATVGVSLAGGE